MFKLITILSAIFALLTLTSLPWVSASLYTLFSVLQPQYVWFWAFDGFPAFKIFAGLVIFAWVVNAIKGSIDYQIYKLPVNKVLFALFALVNISELFSSFPSSFGSELVIELFNITIFMYFACLGNLKSEKGVKYLCLAFIISGVYYAYDGNMAYFNSNWSRFEQGRLGGPVNGAYGDNNKFAILLVITFPFLLFGFFFCKSLVLRALCVVGMMLIVHCIFLTGSRGALLALGASVIYCSRSIKSRLLGYGIILAFLVVVVLQAQGTLNRSKEVVRNSESQEVVNPRIKSWTVGAKLATHYPFLGTGFYRFLDASALHYPGETPHVAHNTLITFVVSLGVLGGVIYLYLFKLCFKMRKVIIERAQPNSLNIYAANSCISALIGFFVGAIFLDMVVFEPFYYLIMLMTTTYFLCEKSAGRD